MHPEHKRADSQQRSIIKQYRVEGMKSHIRTEPLTLMAAELQSTAGQPPPPGAHTRGLVVLNALLPIITIDCTESKEGGEQMVLGAPGQLSNIIVLKDDAQVSVQRRGVVNIGGVTCAAGAGAGMKTVLGAADAVGAAVGAGVAERAADAGGGSLADVPAIREGVNGGGSGGCGRNANDDTGGGGGGGLVGGGG